MLRLVQHVFEPVGAVRNLDREPFSDVVLHATVPVRTEAEDVLIEMIGAGADVNEEAGVNHAMRYGGSGRGDRLGRSALDELDVVPFRVVDREKQAVIGAALNLRSLDSLVDQVAAKGCNVIGGEGDVIHAIGSFWIRGGTETDPLRADHVAHRLAWFNRVG